MTHLTNRQRATVAELLADDTDVDRLGAVVIHGDGENVVLVFGHSKAVIDPMGREI